MAETRLEDMSPGVSNNESLNGANEALVENAEDVWGEERLQEALSTLKEMYIQLRELRSSIPRLVAPLTVKQPSPEVLFQKFANAASAANEELKQFKKLIEDEESKKIFEHAKESRKQNAKGITPWRITEHPDWLTGKT